MCERNPAIMAMVASSRVEGRGPVERRAQVGVQVAGVRHQTSSATVHDAAAAAAVEYGSVCAVAGAVAAQTDLYAR